MSEPRGGGGSSGVVGVATLRDATMGDALFAMRNDGTCCRLQLELMRVEASGGMVGGDAATTTTEDEDSYCLPPLYLPHPTLHS